MCNAEWTEGMFHSDYQLETGAGLCYNMPEFCLTAGRTDVNKRDLFLIAGLIAAAGFLAAFLSMKPMKKEAPSSTVTVVARIDGKVCGVWDLGTDHEEDIDTRFGHNHLSIKNGAARMTEADCPDKYCLYQEEITEEGGMIVCLPHHLIVEVLGEGQ